MSLTLRQGLERYYQANPHFVRDRDLYVGWIRIPWADLQRHDIMHVVTGYSTELPQEMRLIGFLLTALTWRRPWYYYWQSLGVFAEIWGRSLLGRRFGTIYYPPGDLWRCYWQGVAQGRRISPKIEASLDPASKLDCSLTALRAEYGIVKADAWD